MKIIQRVGFGFFFGMIISLFSLTFVGILAGWNLMNFLYLWLFFTMVAGFSYALGTQFIKED